MYFSRWFHCFQDMENVNLQIIRIFSLFFQICIKTKAMAMYICTMVSEITAVIQKETENDGAMTETSAACISIPKARTRKFEYKASLKRLSKKYARYEPHIGWWKLHFVPTDTFLHGGWICMLIRSSPLSQALLRMMLPEWEQKSTRRCLVLNHRIEKGAENAWTCHDFVTNSSSSLKWKYTR